MSATLRVYTRIVVEENASVVLDAGSVVAPHRAVTVDGAVLRQATRALAPGETLALYSYDDHASFDLIAVWVREGGFVDVAVQGDAPTSASDATPLGTSRVWNHTPVSDACPWMLNSRAALVNADPADHAEQNGTTAGFFEDADETRGRIYAVQVKNPDDATEDVTIDYVVVG